MRASEKGETVPVRHEFDGGFTIAAHETQFWTWNFFTNRAPGTGPNQGPIFFQALPKGLSQGGDNTAKNKLVVFDFAVSRGGPGDDHAPEVFYEFKIRNESAISVPFRLEFVLFSDLPIVSG
jgi:hypothetical protein